MKAVIAVFAILSALFAGAKSVAETHEERVKRCNAIVRAQASKDLQELKEIARDADEYLTHLTQEERAFLTRYRNLELRKKSVDAAFTEAWQRDKKSNQTIELADQYDRVAQELDEVIKQFESTFYPNLSQQTKDALAERKLEFYALMPGQIDGIRLRFSRPDPSSEKTADAEPSRRALISISLSNDKLGYAPVSLDFVVSKVRKANPECKTYGSDPTVTIHTQDFHPDEMLLPSAMEKILAAAAPETSANPTNTAR